VFKQRGLRGEETRDRLRDFMFSATLQTSPPTLTVVPSSDCVQYRTRRDCLPIVPLEVRYLTSGHCVGLDDGGSSIETRLHVEML